MAYDMIFWAAVFGILGSVSGIGFSFYLLLKTPAKEYFKAMITKKVVAANPMEDGRFNFEVITARGGLGRSKSGTAFLINPKDRFVEPRSKVPTFLVYGRTGITVHPDDLNLARGLKDSGIDSYNKLEEAIHRAADIRKKYEEEYALISQSIDKLDPKTSAAEIEKLKNRQEKIISELEKYEFIQIGGRSLDPEIVLSHFNICQRNGDIIEAEIQQREIAAAKDAKKSTGDIMKWAIAGAVIIIALVVASSALGVGAGTTNIYQAAQTAATVANATAASGAISTIS